MRDYVAKNDSHHTLICELPDPKAGRERAAHRAELSAFHASEPARRRA